MLVKQYALSREAFEYWQILKKNTESTGTIFDPQPSQLQGNIRCLSNPQEPVIGFVIASTVEQKRTFIAGRDLSYRFINPGYEYCELDTIPNSPNLIIEKFQDGTFVPVLSLGGPLGITDYTYSYKNCVDCREKGGINIRPDFWQ